MRNQAKYYIPGEMMKSAMLFILVLSVIHSPIGEAQTAKGAEGSHTNKAPTKVTKGTEITISKGELSGQVFIVTKSRENIKLALVQVRAIRESDLLQYIKSKNERRGEMSTRLALEFEQLSKDADLSNNEYVAMRGQVMRNTDDLKQFEQLSIEKERKNKKAIDAGLRYQYVRSPAYYFDELPRAQSASKTDADGRFSLSLPVGSYVIAANTNRLVGKDDEQYYWLISVNVTIGSQSLMLSNDNLLESKCPECIQPERVR